MTSPVSGTGRQVRRRAVLYVPGYDPFPARRYRELYRSESAKQAGISGYEIAMDAPADHLEGFGWGVTACMDGQRTQSTVEVLAWSDLVRASMDPPIPVTYLLLLRTAWIYLGSGALFALARLRKGPLIAALLPVVLLLLQLGVALGVGWATYRGVHWAGAAAVQAPGAAAWIPGAAALCGLIALAATLRWFKARDGKLFAYYLMHDYAFSSGLRGRTPQPLQARMDAFADRVARALARDVDEVLVVGHSSGAHLAVSVLADLLRSGRVPPDGPALSLLTLGQVIPMLSFLPEADALRRDLHDLSQDARLTWLDVTAPGDGCAFALCDPVSVSGVAPEQGKRWPLVISVAFTKTLSAATLRRLRRRFFRLHFQYLCAFDHPGDYDYFRITAGPLTLAERFAGRRPSPSRIETARAPYRGRAA